MYSATSSAGNCTDRSIRSCKLILFIHDCMAFRAELASPAFKSCLWVLQTVILYTFVFKWYRACDRADVHVVDDSWGWRMSLLVRSDWFSATVTDLY